MIDIRHGDCIEQMRAMEDASVDSVVTDPPYELGFMGKSWDASGIANSVEMWREAYRVLKPGGHLLAFSATRTQHRMVCAIEDAGFEVRDQIGWCFGSGFPKSLNVNKALGDVVCGCHDRQTHPSEGHPEHPLRNVRGDDPSFAVSSEAEREGVLQLLVSEQDIRSETEGDGIRSGIDGDTRGPATDGGEAIRCEQPILEGRGDAQAPSRQLRAGSVREVSAGTAEHGPKGRLCDGAPASNGSVDRPAAVADGVRASRGSQAAQQRTVKPGTLAGQPQSQDGRVRPVCGRCGKPIVPDGLGTALKPAWEPICVARKPLIGTVAANVLEHGTGALNIDACRIDGRERIDYGLSNAKRSQGSVYGTPTESANFDASKGRWPANIIHDGSDEVLAAFAAFGERKNGGQNATSPQDINNAIYGGGRKIGAPTNFAGDSGTAARFFYAAKASRADRAGSRHPTVKPLSIMKYLVKLVTPPGGTVLDPFAGSGTTLQAAMEEGCSAIGIEREAEYVNDIRNRISAARERLGLFAVAAE